MTTRPIIFSAPMVRALIESEQNGHLRTTATTFFLRDLPFPANAKPLGQAPWRRQPHPAAVPKLRARLGQSCAPRGLARPQPRPQDHPASVRAGRGDLGHSPLPPKRKQGAV